MSWKEIVNSGLSHTVGYHLNRPPGHPARRLEPPGDARMLRAPVFIFSPARSGSTLLRVVLGSHSRLYAPPELPLGHLTARAETRWIQTSMRALELTQDSLDYTLWDAVLADILARSGKPVLVAKTPANVVIWERIADCWPDARFIFLLRHPAAVIASLQAAWKQEWHPGRTGTLDEITRNALWYMCKVEAARTTLSGSTVRYEELTAKPEQVTRRLCKFLRVPFEETMLDYSTFSHARFAPGLGDCSENIRSGQIKASAPPPRLGEVSPALAKMCTTWGYQLDAEVKPDAEGQQEIPVQLDAQGEPVEPDAEGQPGIEFPPDGESVSVSQGAGSG